MKQIQYNRSPARLDFTQKAITRRMFNPKRLSEYRGYVLDDSSHLLDQAKRLHAHVYLKRHFIGIKDVSAAGYMTDMADPHQYYSRYFVVCDATAKPERVVVTARQIQTLHTKTHDDLPIISEAHIFAAKKVEILKYSPDACVEISGLAKHISQPSLPALMVYRLMWLYSLEHKHKIWLMACDPALYKRLKYFFGDTIERIGNNTPYTGNDVVPAMLKLDEAVGRMERQSQTLHPFRRGLYRSVLEFFEKDADLLDLR